MTSPFDPADEQRYADGESDGRLDDHGHRIDPRTGYPTDGYAQHYQHEYPVDPYQAAHHDGGHQQYPQDPYAGQPYGGAPADAGGYGYPASAAAYPQVDPQTGQHLDGGQQQYGGQHQYGGDGYGYPAAAPGPAAGGYGYPAQDFGAEGPSDPYGYLFREQTGGREQAGSHGEGFGQVQHEPARAEYNEGGPVEPAPPSPHGGHGRGRRGPVGPEAYVAAYERDRDPYGGSGGGVGTRSPRPNPYRGRRPAVDRPNSGGPAPASGRPAYPRAEDYRLSGARFDFTIPPVGAEMDPSTTGSIPIIRMPESGPRRSRRDQQAGGEEPQTSSTRFGSLFRSSALMASGSLVSKLTGFVKNVVVVAAIGSQILGESYNSANTLPTMIYILVGGGALNAVFVPQLVRSMREDDDQGEAYANRLLTMVMVGLGFVVLLAVLGAPLLVRLVSEKLAVNPTDDNVTTAFVRYCIPVIFFMGIHVVIGQILNARDKFGPMMWTPVLNNIVVIFTFVTYMVVFGRFTTTHVDTAHVTPAGVRLLGLGTMLGLVVQALSMIPYLRQCGFRFRLRFDWRGHGMGRAFGLAKWTFLFVLANQAGLLVITQLATATEVHAERHGLGGVGWTAYSQAFLIWGIPQSVITVSVMTAVLPRISRAAADGDHRAVRDDISHGLRTSAVAIIPCAFIFLALGEPIGMLLYQSSAGTSGSRIIGYMLMGFGLGLIPFSAQYVMLRGFYAYEDTKTPFFNTLWVAGTIALVSVLCYEVLPSRWAVTGMAVANGIGYAVGIAVAARRLKVRLGGDMDGPRIVRTYVRLIGACLISAVIAFLVSHLITGVLGSGFFGCLLAVIVGAVILLVGFVLLAQRMRVSEMNAMVGMIRGKLGR